MPYLSDSSHYDGYDYHEIDREYGQPPWWTEGLGYSYDDEEDLEEPLSWHSVMRRFLAEKKKDSEGRMDYSVLSVTVMTLGLIMVVEVIRHRLDHMAMGRPYFSAVLENIYAELSTLGIVEFFVFLLQRYHTAMNKDKKAVFGDVHFALFYTAILNAFQSIILAFITYRVSNRLWVKTEALELNHYVEVREEFERVKALLEKKSNKDAAEEEEDENGMKKPTGTGGSSTNSSDEHNEKEGDGDEEENDHRSTASRSFVYHTEYVFEASWKGIKGAWDGIVDAIQRPRLNHQYNKLLIQVRFHELRVHFLQSYNLPPKFKISEYLIRCELNVLIKLVHVSIVAWLLLTASANLLYFVLGMVGYFEESAEVVGVAMIYIYFASMAIFVIVALLVFNKVKWIYGQIMHREELWETVRDHDDIHGDSNDDDESYDSERRRKLAKEQRALFWGGSPKIVIAALQFMQFGYAVALSIVLMFWETIDNGDVPMAWYFIAILICYPFFVGVAANVIPRYTLCTSLAQLVDKKRLNETVANFHLEEAKRQREADTYMHAHNNDPHVAVVATKGGIDLGGTTTATQNALSETSSLSSNEVGGATSEEGKELTIADLVNVDTTSLRDVVPEADTASQTTLLSNREMRRERRRRQRAISDGVAMMASMKEEEEEKTEVEGDWMRVRSDPTAKSSQNEREHFGRSAVSARGTSAEEPTPSTRRLRIRRKAVSDGVAAMAAMTPKDGGRPPRPPPMERVNSERIASLVKVDTASLREQLSQEELLQLEENKNQRRGSGSGRVRSKSDPNKMKEMTAGPQDTNNEAPATSAEERKRRRRQRTVSDGVQLMANFTQSLAFFNPIKSEASAAASDALSQSNAAEDEVKEAGGSNISQADDEDSDNLSDMDDIPDVDMAHLNEFRRVEVERKHTMSVHDRLKRYFTSKRFPLISNVFGTMVAFFLIGSRVERFLHTEDIVSRDFISFDFNQAVTFWILSCWYLFFMVGDCLVYWAVDRFAIGRRFRVAWVASVIDAVIVGVSFIVLWSAESQRCCDTGDKERLLAGESDVGPAPCDCPVFGSRLYGGLGTIEPWTSLVALRLFRFNIAKRIVARMDQKRGIQPTAAEQKEEVDNEENLDPFNVYSEHIQAHAANSVRDGHHEHGGDHGHDDHGHAHRGSAAELWEAAIGEHPEIAKQYGMFSSEVLQVMLGLQVHLPQDEYTMTTTTASQPGVENGQLQRDVGSVLAEPANPRQTNMRASYVLDNKYTALSLDAQEIIMQGQLGRNVQTISSLGNVQTIPEEDVAMRNSSYVFQVAEEPSIAPSVDLDQQLPFDAPNARLVRSMRRCDRKLIPILNKWTVVDVVMTRFEMVYFDASNSLEGPEVDATRQAIKATKGGKNLRLKDVAVGRKVVGHLLLADVDSLAIERYMPSEEGGHSEDGPEALVPETEFWKEETMHFTRNDAWAKTKQDTLAIHTKHGNTLYLRFYSDLEEAEHHPERAEEEEEEGHLCKNNAFQWIQTIGRFCGPEQLHQSLPHFGDDTDEELRDYLVVHHQGELKKHMMFLGHHGANLRHHETVAASSAKKRAASARFSNLMGRSSTNMKSLEAIANEDAEEFDSTHAAGSFKGFGASFRRSQSMGETDPNGGSNRSLKGMFRRSVSLGEDTETPAKSDPAIAMPTVEEVSEALRNEQHGEDQV